MTYLVYKHTSPSGKSYIGQTDDYNRRSIEHQAISSQCRAFYAAIKKYGWDNFTHEILYDELTLERANAREQQSINEYGTMAPYGYNLTSGGDSKRHSDVTKAKISASKQANPRYKTDAEKEHLRQLNLGKTISAVQKAAISAAHKGKTISAEQIAARAKTYIVITPTGEQLTIHNLSEFCDRYNLTASCMRAVAYKKQTSHKGWLCTVL